ncbi:hypothetical protein DMJ13_12370 [halophilic archaeon]|nr:hypothetical protein DMJ13_12370 [halophilic archaeon]
MAAGATDAAGDPEPRGPVGLARTAGLVGAAVAAGVAVHVPETAPLVADVGTASVGRTTPSGRFRRLFAPFWYGGSDESDPLDHEVRAELYERVERTPGVYLSQLDDGTDVSLSTVRHHLRTLEDEGLVSSAKLRGKRRFFPDDEDVELTAALADPATAAVLDAVARREAASVGELADDLDRDPSTVSHHLSRLADDGLVERERDGRTVVSRLTATAEAAFAGPVAPADD